MKLKKLVAGLAVAISGILLSGSVQGQPANLTNGLVAYYPLNGNAIDRSGNGYNGVQSNIIATTNRFGHVGRASYFSGANSYIAVPTFPSLPSTWTISFWMSVDWNYLKTTPLPQRTDGSGFFILDHRTGGTGGYDASTGYQIVLNEYTVNYGLQGWFFGGYGGAPPGSRPTVFTPNDTIPNNSWCQVLLTLSNGTSSVFINGLLKSTTSLADQGIPTFRFQDSQSPLTIGSGVWRPSFYDENFHGSLSELRFYTNATSEAAALAIFQYEQQSGCLGATATVQTVNGFIVGSTVTDGGYGYTQTPRVWFTGGGGTLAAASASIDTNGVVTAINITNPGSGYTTNVQIVIEPPVFPVPSISPALGEKIVFSQLQPGTNYQLQRLTDTTWSDAGITVSPTNSTFTTTVSDRGNYRLLQLPLFQTAKVTASVVNGFLVAITVTNGGTGYTTPPSVTITDATGTGATATATVTAGVVTSITVQSPGKNYSGSPTITVAAPPVAGIVGTGTPTLTLNVSGLFPNVPYQLERSTDLKTLQSVGNAFVPTGTTYGLSVDMSGYESFYRVVYKR